MRTPARSRALFASAAAETIKAWNAYAEAASRAKPNPLPVHAAVRELERRLKEVDERPNTVCLESSLG